MRFPNRNTPAPARAPVARKRVCVALSAALIAALPFSASAQQQTDYPRKPIRVVVPFAPGGSTDIVGRIIAAKLTEGFGQQAFVDNRGGAGGNIGTDIVAKAPADGYTLLVCAVSTLAISASLYSKLPYDVSRDLEPVALVGSVPFVLIVNSSLPVRNVKELIALAKANPGQLTFGSAGTGSTAHLSGELLKSLASIDMTHVPYKGNAPAMADVISGQVQLMFDFMPSALPHIQSGKVRALGVTPTRRSRAMPQVPTIAEAGVKGYDVDSYFGVLAPARTPAAVVNKLNAEINRMADLPDVRERYAREGLEPTAQTPERFRTYLQSELAKWAKVVKASGARVD